MASTRRRRVVVVRMEDSDSERTSVCEDETFDMTQVEDEKDDEDTTAETPVDNLSLSEDEVSSSSSGTSKPQKAMTVRQKALIEGKRRRKLAEVAKRKRYQETVPLTEEEILKAKRLAIRRRELARAKDEKEKQETVNRLLKFKSSPANTARCSSASSPAVDSGLLSSAPETSADAHTDDDRLHMIRFLSNTNMNSYSYPSGFEFPIKSIKALPIPLAKICAIEGCGKPRKYVGRQSGHSVCSLQCYKLDLQSIKA